jgi:hypothetical protein
MDDKRASFEQIKAVTLKLLTYCRTNSWEGYDPYDALNSAIFKYLPFLDFKLPRLILTQILKRSPFNFRPLLLIPKTQNPKAIALFLMAFQKLARLGLLDQENLTEMMVGKLVALRSQNNPYWCWGYSFPWQTQRVMVPRGAPNVICTSFVAHALLDAYEKNQETNYLNMAVSAAEFILNELYWTDQDSVASFSYIPSIRTQVHNANFLGASVLCRAYRYCGQKKFLNPALKVARYSAGKQHDDGSWYYSESPSQRWVDNFHTGYNLVALKTISQYAEVYEFNSYIRRGFEFYRNHFFRKDGSPKYFHDRSYPIDIHSVAQSIITLLAFKEIDHNNISLSHSVFAWAMTNMWDERGYFYYQVYPFFTSKIPYMRWSHAWMLFALTTLMEEGIESSHVSGRSAD